MYSNTYKYEYEYILPRPELYYAIADPKVCNIMKQITVNAIVFKLQWIYSTVIT